MTVEKLDVELWFIRDANDPSFHSIPFSSEEEALKTIDETELFTSHTAIKTIFPVTYDEKVMNARARNWVAENLETSSIASWTTEEVWGFIKEFHVAGKSGFLVLSAL